eukprot:CAMPEP_0197534860 /NCGR_PEP_ID=MMETSP1318-20131121/48582_1 /TAXON_ID=552666 /ORGANISM="Partenskyella glossopodia, Strain RCC365" /LENGTH=103 /DNA_ID=CAMNT_0043092277 /DNA_START=492 /DNA_END=802 /DNA_ORIENTATION=+
MAAAFPWAVVVAARAAEQIVHDSQHGLHHTRVGFESVRAKAKHKHDRNHLCESRVAVDRSCCARRMSQRATRPEAVEQQPAEPPEEPPRRPEDAALDEQQQPP